jgi:glucokinase
MILAGDIGGTNSRIAFFDGGPEKPRVAALEVYPSGTHKGLEEILQKFLAKHRLPVEGACFGIAGPVSNGRVETPNLPWVVDSASLARLVGVDSVRLANDLEVNAHGISVLGPSDFAVLNPGSPNASGNRALISAGTGLGEAGLLAEAGGYRPYATEGGHADFAPRNETEIELLKHLMKRFEHVSFERVLSGPGLHNVYQFFRDKDPGREPSWLADELRQGDPAAVVTEHALKGDSDLCVRALDLFTSVYGSEAGNLALKAMALGGVFLGGGIAPRIIQKLRQSEFMKAFKDKGRVSKLLDAIPVQVILNDKTALLGAGRLGMLLSSNAKASSGRA